MFYGMDILKQIAIILGCLAFGEATVYITQINFPSSIVGLITLLFLLKSGCVKVEQLKAVGDFLLRYMGLFFVPPCVAIIQYYQIIEASFWPIVVATLASTIMVVIVTGFVHQLLRKKQ